MKIQSYNQGVIDTDKLADNQAELAEETERFKKFVRDRNGELFIWVKVPGKTAWSSIDIKEITSVVSAVEAINMAVQSTTENKVGVTLAPKSVIDLIKNGGKEEF